MRTYLVVLPGVLLLMAASPRPGISQAGSVGFGGITRLLPVGPADVDVMEVAGPPRYQELSRRFIETLRRDPEWTAAYVRAAPETGPLPYHPRLGLTEVEYREMLTLIDSLRIRAVGVAPLIVRSIATGWRLDGDSTLSELTGIEIDTVAGVIRTPFGQASGPTLAPATAKQHVTGPVDQLVWKHEALSPDVSEGVSINFSLGRLRESGRTLLYYDAKRMAGGALAARASRMLLMDAPRGESAGSTSRTAIDGRLLTPGIDTLYSIALRAHSMDTIGVAIQTLVRSTGRDGDEWLQVYHYKDADSSSALDSLVMDYATLRPLRHARRTPHGRVHLTYDGARVRGVVEPTSGAASQIDTTFERSFFGSAAFDLIARALPLPASYATEVYLYNPHPSPPGLYRARMWVERSDVIQGAPGGTYDCWVVVGALPGSDMRIWIDKRSRIIVQMVADEGDGRLLYRR